MVVQLQLTNGTMVPSEISGETSDTYTTNSLVDGDQISVVMTSNATCISGNPATSNTLTMTINPLPSVSFSGLSASYCATGIPATLTGSPAGGTFSGTGISGNTFDPAAGEWVVLIPLLILILTRTVVRTQVHRMYRLLLL
jgi:hypothetical protein